MRQRAPRLRPDQYLADSMTTRAGRFARRDPRKGRKLPSLLQMLGVLAWAGLVIEAFRRARAAAAGATETDAEAVPETGAAADPGAARQPGAAAGHAPAAG